MHSTGTGQPVETQDVFFWRLAGRSAPTGLAIVHWIGCINAIKWSIYTIIVTYRSADPWPVWMSSQMPCPCFSCLATIPNVLPSWLGWMFLLTLIRVKDCPLLSKFTMSSSALECHLGITWPSGGEQTLRQQQCQV